MSGNGIARPSGAGATITLNGEMFRLAPFTLRDWGELENHLIREKRKLLLRDIADQRDALPPDVWQVEWDKALEKADKITTIPEEEIAGTWYRDKSGKVVHGVPGWVDTRPGIAYTLWIMIEKTTPGRFKSPKEIEDILLTLEPIDFADIKTGRDQAATLDEAAKNSTGPTSPPPLPTAPAAGAEIDSGIVGQEQKAA